MTPLTRSSNEVRDASADDGERRAPVVAASRTSRLLVTGNPNVGKSVLFQLLTGRYATVSNYPGTTVMIATGTATIDGAAYQVSDTPGLNSLAASSEDELVARDQLVDGDAVVVQVADAKNLVRALALTLELAEVGAPTVLALNMIDEARERQITIDTHALSTLLGAPVIPTIATQRWGATALRRAIPQACPSTGRVTYPRVIEQALAAMERLLPPSLRGRRALALLWLGGDQAIRERLERQLPPPLFTSLSRIVLEAQERSAAPLAVRISQARWREARRLASRVTTAARPARRRWLERVGAWAMHPVWGIPILLGVLAVMYFLVGDIAAQRGVQFLEATVFGRYLTPAFRSLIEWAIPWTWLQALFVGPYGLLTMALPYAFAIILPIVTMFFFCFGFLEDVGYLPRLAVMANRGCRVLGLNGKAVLPLVLGLGCDTMATMTARILESKRDRILVTLLLTLGIPCSAQLGVILAMLGGRPPLAAAVWLAVMALVTIVVGRAAARLLPGEESPFLYEIPPLRRPKFSNLLVKTLGRVEWYVKEAVPLFFAGTLVLFVLNATGLLTRLEHWCAPVIVAWLGIPAKATGAFIVGFLRRDFGAAGFFALQRAGQLNGVQVVVSLVTITLFVPCIAQYLMMVKERGWKLANVMAAFVFGTALLTGGVLYRVLTILKAPV